MSYYKNDRSCRCDLPAMMLLLLLAPIAAASQLEEALRNVTSSPIGLTAKEDAVLDFHSYFGSRRPSPQQGGLAAAMSVPSTRGISDGVIMGVAPRFQKPYNICTRCGPQRRQVRVPLTLLNMARACARAPRRTPPPPTPSPVILRPFTPQPVLGTRLWSATRWTLPQSSQATK